MEVTSWSTCVFGCPRGIQTHHSPSCPLHLPRPHNKCVPSSMLSTSVHGPPSTQVLIPDSFSHSPRPQTHNPISLCCLASPHFFQQPLNCSACIHACPLSDPWPPQEQERFFLNALEAALWVGKRFSWCGQGSIGAAIRQPVHCLSHPTWDPSGPGVQWEVCVSRTELWSHTQLGG